MKTSYTYGLLQLVNAASCHHCTTANEPKMSVLWRQNLPVTDNGGTWTAISWLAGELLQATSLVVTSMLSQLPMSMSSKSSSSATSSAARSSWRFLALAISAACRFRHLVRRFWNHTWTPIRQQHQRGFLSRYSTCSQLLECVEDWTMAIHNC